MTCYDHNMRRWVACIGVGALVVGCGKTVTSPREGAAGSSSNSSGAPADGGSGSTEAGGAPTQEAGAAGAAGGGLEPIEELDPTLVTDAQELDGLSFDLTGSLCPTLPWVGDERLWFLDDDQSSSLPGFHLQLGAAGKLEAVTYTADGGNMRVVVAPMTPSGDGWDMRDVPICAALGYYFEEEFRTTRIAAQRLHVAFHRTTPSAPLVASLTATVAAEERRSGGDEPYPGERLTSEAVPDHSAPSALPPDYGQHAGVDGFATGLTQVLMLREPVADLNEVTLLDANGDAAAFRALESSGYVVGLQVEDVLLEGAVLHLKVTDLAGNDWQSDELYRGVALEPTSTNFEADSPLFTSEIWSNLGFAPDCRDVGVHPSGDTGPYDEPLPPPLEGNHSLLVGGDQCETFLRVLRPPGTTRLVFDARRLSAPGISAPGQEDDLFVEFWSLDADEGRYSRPSPPTWTNDPQYSTSRMVVSTVQTLSYPLPPNANDLLVGLGMGSAWASHFWLDSLRFE